MTRIIFSTGRRWTSIQREADTDRDLPVRHLIARNLKCIEFSSEARDLYIQRYPQLTADHEGLFGVVISRAEVQVIRLALIYALLDASHEIVVNHLKAAFAVWDYCSASAARLFGSIAINPLEARMLSALRDGSKTKTELHRATGGHTNAAAMDAALENLQRQGRIFRTTESTSGRPSDVWHLSRDANEAKDAK